MIRTNTFEVRPRSETDEVVLRRLLDASASLWNEVTYERRQRFFADESVWDTGTYYDRYKGVLGAATAQTVIRKNESAWESFFALLEDPDQDANLPGYWGNDEEGRDLKAYLRNDTYTVEWGDRSRLEILIGKDLKSEFGFDRGERLRLEICGAPKWAGKQGRLELYYDETAETYRAIQPVTVSEDQQDSPLASHEAALDIGVNNLVACTTTTGKQYLYEGRNVYEKYLETTEEISQLASELPEEVHTSRRINRLYKQRTRRRNHARDALIRDLVERLHGEGVDTVYIGDLEGILQTHWSAKKNQLLHNFWAYRRFKGRLSSVCEEYGIVVHHRDEAWTTQECADCGRTWKTTREGDKFRCQCGYEAHADLSASLVFLQRHSNAAIGSMARPVQLSWDSHTWRPITVAPQARTNTPEDCTDRSTT